MRRSNDCISHVFPYAGEGFVQSLVLIFVPDPQLLEQEPQSPQFDHAPFTVIYNDNAVFN
jgi:hypothetical protein